MRRSYVTASLGFMVGLLAAAPVVAEQEFLFYFGFGPSCG
jgi:hypothetical protein